MTRTDHRPATGTAVVTGASSGVGRATARRLAGRGTRLALAARDTSGLREVASECETVHGTEAIVVPTDVSDPGQVQVLADRTRQHFGRIDAWVNNAAVMAYGTVRDLPVETFKQVVETNLLGTVYGSRAALEVFNAQDAGSLVNVASLYARLTSPYVSPYVASKFGVLGFSRCLREELTDRADINVSVVLPEAVDTPIFEHAANHTGRQITALPPAMDPDRVVDAIVGCIDQPKPEVTVGTAGRLMTYGQGTLRRLGLARLYERLARDAMELVGLRDEPAPDSAGNVFDPSPDRNRIDGGWRQQRRATRRLVTAGLIGLALTPLIGWWWQGLVRRSR